jgi:hypothetical protein
MDESTKWEYRQLLLSATEFPEASSSRPVTEVTGKIHERMSTLGDQGWELAAAVQIDGDRQLLIFKRPKKEREPKKGRL